MSVAAVVAGGDDYHDAGIPDGLGCLHQGIIGGLGLDGLAERHVDHLDALAGGVGEHPVEGGDDVGGIPATGAIQHLEGGEG